jgi:hypothetical protein
MQTRRSDGAENANFYPSKLEHFEAADKRIIILEHKRGLEHGQH